MGHGLRDARHVARGLRDARCAMRAGWDMVCAMRATLWCETRTTWLPCCANSISPMSCMKRLMVCSQLSMPPSLWDPSRFVHLPLAAAIKSARIQALAQVSLSQQRGAADVDFVDRLVFAQNIHLRFQRLANQADTPQLLLGNAKIFHCIESMQKSSEIRSMFPDPKLLLRKPQPRKSK
jgi:hypothetical protein